MSRMHFGDAITALKLGKRVAREGWHGNDMWLAIQRPDANSNTPYIYMRTADDSRVPWNASHADILSEDWVVAT